MSLQKKICLLSASGAGKTSLVRQFVQSIYSEKYHTTIGVKVDKKSVTVENTEMTLMLWDLQGEDGEFRIRPSFVRGASGYLLVIDLTRRETLVTAFSIQQMIEREVGKMPFYALLNKNDLTENHEISGAEIEDLKSYNWQFMQTSAKTGENVEAAFHALAAQMLDKI